MAGCITPTSSASPGFSPAAFFELLGMSEWRRLESRYVRRIEEYDKRIHQLRCQVVKCDVLDRTRPLW